MERALGVGVQVRLGSNKGEDSSARRMGDFARQTEESGLEPKDSRELFREF